MDIINWTEEDYNNIVREIIFNNKLLDQGIEGYIIEDGKSVIKLFKGFKLPKKQLVLKNKKKKLILLNEKGPNEKWPLIEALIFIKDYFVAYKMPNYKDMQNLKKFNCYELNEEIAVMQKLKQDLLEMYEEQICYFDIYQKNIFIKTKNKKIITKFLDIDNIRIGSLPEDIHNSYLNRYRRHGGTMNINTIIYMFNQLTFWYLMGSVRFGYKQEEILKAVSSTVNCKYVFENNFMVKLIRQVPEIKDFFKKLAGAKVDSVCDHEFLIDYVINNQLDESKNSIQGDDFSGKRFSLK